MIQFTAMLERQGALQQADKALKERERDRESDATTEPSRDGL